MAYKNDSLLTISDKFGKSRGECVAELFETYDRLRDISISGPTFGSPGYGTAASFLMNMAKLVAPSSFMPVLGDSSFGLPGTSYFSSAGGSNILNAGSQAAFGIGKLGTFPGLPTGGAAGINALPLALGAIGFPLMSGIGNLFSSLDSDYAIGGMPTGGASSVGSTLVPAAGIMSGLSAGYGQGPSIVLPAAGIIAGLGGIASSIGPYFGPFGIAASIIGNMASGYGGAVLNTYQTTTQRILNNADVTLSNKVKNIEMVVKQIDAQGSVIQKMLKDSADYDSKQLQNL